MQPEGDLWDHTMLVLDLLPPDPSFPLAFAALAARRRQAADQGVSITAATAFTTTNRPARGSPTSCAEPQALQRRARADHLARR